MEEVKIRGPASFWLCLPFPFVIAEESCLRLCYALELQARGNMVSITVMWMLGWSARFLFFAGQSTYYFSQRSTIIEVGHPGSESWCFLQCPRCAYGQDSALHGMLASRLPRQWSEHWVIDDGGYCPTQGLSIGAGLGVKVRGPWWLTAETVAVNCDTE